MILVIAPDAFRRTVRDALPFRRQWTIGNIRALSRIPNGRSQRIVSPPPRQREWARVCGRLSPNRGNTKRRMTVWHVSAPSNSAILWVNSLAAVNANTMGFALSARFHAARLA
jgi:hypothetical protein